MSALDKLKEKNEALKQSMAKKAKRMKAEKGAILHELAGQTGGAVAAVGLAAIDAKHAEVGETADLGDTGIPIALGGLLLQGAAIALVGVSPALACGVGRAGSFGVDLTIYFASRKKFDEMFDS